MKTGFVCVYGRANVGKSTLINKCLGFKLLPVADKPQTTRDNVHAIYNDENSQIVFTDTPGVFRPHGKLGSILLRDAESAKEGVDLIVYVIDASEVPDFTLAQKLSKEQIPVLIAYNKIDLVSVKIGEERLARYLAFLPDAKVFRMSAEKGYGVKELLDEIKDRLPEGEPFFPTDIVSDRPKEYIISEIIREKCMRLLSAEVPHSIYIDCQKVEETEKEMTVYADIIVEKDSEKGIVIGKGGKMLSQIRRFSEMSIQSYFGLKALCELHVKCIPDWRNSDKYLRQFGYEER